MRLTEHLSESTDRLHRHWGAGAVTEHADPDYDFSSAALDARLLASKCTGLSVSALVGGADVELSDEQKQRLDRLLHARLDGWPVAYLTGEREFYSLSFNVNPYVLIPRPDTELLVEQTLALADDDSALRILELGTGSGCVSVALAAARPGWRVLATDQCRGVLNIARANAESNGVRNIRWKATSWFDDMDEEYDVVVANPPYIAADMAVLNSLRYEPLGALYGGLDGLEDIRHIIDHARSFLRPGGRLLIEIGVDQADPVAERARQKSYQDVHILKDLANHPRLLSARRD
ncbi:MAG: peptide chain release factor N(5)-glutamine methyltransferase [Gammaproteobacteria bacterium]|nr:peptide chain release factor N(5)-glutamine methyltransferase [Gammaproteobacteria bacterium]